MTWSLVTAGQSAPPCKHRAEKRLELMEVRLRAQMAVRVDECLAELPMCLGGVHRCELRCRRQKGADDAFVLLWFARAGGVNEASTRSDHLGGVLEHRQLRCCEWRQIAFLAPPADVGIAPQGAETRAGRVHQHACERAA